MFFFCLGTDQVPFFNRSFVVASPCLLKRVKGDKYGLDTVYFFSGSKLLACTFQCSVTLYWSACIVFYCEASSLEQLNLI